MLDIQQTQNVNCINEMPQVDDSEYERLIEHYAKENALLEQKRILLAKEIVEENLSLIQLQVDLAMQQLVQ